MRPPHRTAPRRAPASPGRNPFLRPGLLAIALLAAAAAHAGDAVAGASGSGDQSGTAADAGQDPNADDRSRVNTLPTVNVAESQTGHYAPDVVSFGKFDQQLKDIPQSISVITRQRLDDQNLSTLEQALAQTTGVVVETRNMTQPNFVSRGFTVQTYQVDGVPMSNGNSQPDLAMYEQVEILRGAAGIFNGSGQPGGTLNLVRKRPTRQVRADAALSLGSWNNARLEGDVSGALSRDGRLRGRAVAVYEDRDYFYDVAESNKRLVYGILEYEPVDGLVLTAGGSRQKSGILPFLNGLPRYSDGRDIGFARSTFLAPAWNDWDLDDTRLFAEAERRFDNDWKVRLSAQYRRDHNTVKDGYIHGEVDPRTLAGPTLRGENNYFRNAETAIDLSLAGAIDAFGRRHDFVAGFNRLENEGQGGSQPAPYQAPYAEVDVFGFDPYGIPQPRFNDWVHGTDTRNTQYGLYAVQKIRPSDRLTLIAGGRMSWWKNESVNLATGARSNVYEVSNEFTPYGGLVFDIDDTWSSYLSYADIFRVQNAYTFRGDLLPPVVGANYEAGVKGALLSGRLDAAFALFRIVEDNRSQPDPLHPSPCSGHPTGGACSIAEGKVESKGMELEISGRIAEGWDVFAGYTYNRTRYLKDRTVEGAPSGNEGQPYQSFVPRHLFRLWTNYRLPGAWNRLSLGGGVTLQGAQYKTSGSIRIEQGGYAIFSLRAGYEISERISAGLNFNNLFDKTYFTAIGTTQSGNYYGEPRNVMFTLRARY